MTNFWLKRQYAEASTEADGLARRGYVYLLSEYIDLAGNAVVSLGLTTNGVQVEFQFYDIASSVTVAKAELIEAPTVTKSSSTIVGRNLNRNYTDTHTVTFHNISGLSGGTVVACELVGGGSKTGGSLSSAKIHVLKPETDYVMRFTNLVNQATLIHLNLGWSEGEPDPKPLWTT